MSVIAADEKCGLYKKAKNQGDSRLSFDPPWHAVFIEKGQFPYKR